MFKSILFSVLLCFCFFGCDQTVMEKANNKKIADAENLMTSQPAPTTKWSMDRYLLGERLTRFNDPNKMCYLYLVFCDGTWLKATIIGKLSSTSKRLTSPEVYTKVLGTGTYEVMPAPDEMGTYGSSDPAHVGMTTLGSLIEAGGFMSYIYSEVPLTFTNMNKPMVEMVVNVTAVEKQALLEKLEALKREVK